MYALGYPLNAVVNIVDALLLIYTFIIIAVVIFSWVNPDPLNPLVRILRNLAEPVLDRVRPYIPLVGGVDLTPLAVVVAIYFVRSGILEPIGRMARDMIQA